MAEQANVYFFSIKKSFRKHIKMIKYQDEKQAKAIGEHGKQLTKATNEFTEKQSLPPTKEKKNSKILLMKEWTKWKNYAEVLILQIKFHYKVSTEDKDFNGFVNAENLYKELNSHKTKLNDAEKNQVVKSKVKSIWVI